MENNFYVGIVCHKKMFYDVVKEKTVLYTDNKIIYIDLVKNKIYTLDTSLKDYVDKDSLIPIDISDLNIDYSYLLMKYQESKKIRKKGGLK